MTQTAKHYRWSDRPAEIILGGIERRYIASETMMVGQVRLRKGDLVPMHSHPNEQFTFVVAGAMHFWCGEGDIAGTRVAAGEIIIIPPDVPHRAEVLEDTLEYDLFHPPRLDWMDSQATLLRD
ncbi:cupin domain-containing protein [Cupriavidus sp. 2SB]|uniref:cupin domain-containing protein n=1 Tax=Cupriavidus sp. 2SB TaxID=2502199 RepID=UPI0010F5F661|nr:cupin domain-containing protein [Cupriavidus sp. 2SB]